MSMTPRTYLFVPGTRPERFAKALGSGVDAIVLDLEDAVSIDDKDLARRHVAAWCRDAMSELGERIVVRVNDRGSRWFEDDLRAMGDAGVTQVLLPKAESAADISSVRVGMPGARVLALIESARGVAQVEDVAAAAGVSRLVFGTLDFALDLDMDIAVGSEGLAYAASRIAIASRINGLPAPVAGVTPQIGDEARLLDDLSLARRLGFGAKLCIHPKQVAPIHLALRPGADALDWARRVVAAAAGSTGAVQLDGRMIDRPVVLQAQRTLTLGDR